MRGLGLRDNKGRFLKGYIPWCKGKKGIHLSPESEFKKGRHASSATEFKKGNIPWDKGKKLHYYSSRALGKKQSPETIEKRVLPFRGKNHWNWKGGRSKDKNVLRQWRQTYHTRRRTWEKNGGEFNSEILQKVYEANIKKYGTLTCYLCLKKIQFGRDSIDHKMPLSRGGTNEYKNLAVAHRKCNSRKGAKTEEEYREKIKFEF